MVARKKVNRYVKSTNDDIYTMTLTRCLSTELSSYSS